MIRGNPRITISRTSPKFLEKLFENEVPEIFDGLITIKKVVRQPGERAKVCVESYDDRIDPVGACVGMNGSRIHSIVRELQNENIDVINNTDNLDLYINRALSPAKISSVQICTFWVWNLLLGMISQGFCIFVSGEVQNHFTNITNVDFLI